MLDTPEAAEAAAVRTKDRDWNAPVLWRSEFRNLLMRYVRTGDMSLAKASEAVARADRLIRARAVGSERVLELAAASGCTAYDCEFVSVAERLNVPLITGDKQLLAAFPATAVTMHDFLAL